MNPKTYEDVLRRWIKAGPENETPVHEDLIMWGVWVAGIGDDEYHPPEAVFRSKVKAEAFAVMFDVREYDVAPCLLTLMTRDNFEVPEAAAAQVPGASE
jgi:hypothetical protein